MKKTRQESRTGGGEKCVGSSFLFSVINIKNLDCSQFESKFVSKKIQMLENTKILIFDAEGVRNMDK